MSRQKNSTHRDWRSNATRLVAGAVVVVLLSTAFIKMMDIEIPFPQQVVHMMSGAA
ncbi:MAG: hypothetical protein JRJ27_20755 [Deltaproteobacteria bacterium]|jgi:hypothetical protein|nr:hypothetical protein [Deltaproteobacteria bacterium]